MFPKTIRRPIRGDCHRLLTSFLATEGVTSAVRGEKLHMHLVGLKPTNFSHPILRALVAAYQKLSPYFRIRTYFSYFS